MLGSRAVASIAVVASLLKMKSCRRCVYYAVRSSRHGCAATAHAQLSQMVVDAQAVVETRV